MEELKLIMTDIIVRLGYDPSLVLKINPSRKRKFREIRHALMYYLVKNHKLSLTDAGRALAGFDHASVYYAFQKIDMLVYLRDKETKELLNRIERNEAELRSMTKKTAGISLIRTSRYF